jgi:ethanolamine utilization protein EutQ
MAKRIITEADVLEAAAANKSLCVPPEECIVTDQARDRALELGVALVEGAAAEVGGNAATAAKTAATAGPAAVAALRGQSVDQLVRQACEALRGKLPAGADPGQVERLVRESVESKMTGAPRPAGAAKAPEGVVFIEARAALAPGAGSVPATDGALLAEVLGPPGPARLAVGYLSWSGASFSRKVEAPELGIVIEGELHLTTGGATIIGKPGDMIYLSQGVTAEYSAPGKVLLACVNGVS